MSVDRGVSPVAPRAGGLTKTHGVIAICSVTAVAIGWIFLHDRTPAKKEDKGAALKVGQVSHYEPLPPLPKATPATFAMPVIPPPVVAPPPAQEVVAQTPDPMAKARHAPLLAYGSKSGGESKPSAEPGARGETKQTELGAKLVPTQVSTVTATVLKNQPYLLTRGTQIQCVLLTAIDSTLPGPISCRLPYDVIGKTGLTLLDRGSIVVGETGGTMNQGQKRLFALWSRAETPQGVVVNMDSPGADPLGRAGFEGTTDSHFFERVGNALLLSVVQGGMQVASSAVSGGGSTQINLGGTESAVSEALRGSVNIRPTLRMNQGDTISISVVRDMDFASVYSVSVR